MDWICSIGLVLQFVVFYPLSAPLMAYDQQHDIPTCWHPEFGYDAHVQAWYAHNEQPPE